MKTLAIGLLALALGGITRPLVPATRLEAGYFISQTQTYLTSLFNPKQELPKSAPVIFQPLVDESGNEIIPSDANFSIIVPKIGINAAVVSAVDPAHYDEALQKGVAHASTSFFPNENGAVYLFSHSTDAPWNIVRYNVFYLMKNLEADDLVILIYKGTRYTYKLTEKRIVSPKDVSYIAPMEGKKMLILQTCWPPGSTTQRLLVFANLIDIAYNK